MTDKSKPPMQPFQGGTAHTAPQPKGTSSADHPSTYIPPKKKG